MHPARRPRRRVAEVPGLLWGEEGFASAAAVRQATSQEGDTLVKATLSLLVVALLTCISCKDSGTDPPPDNGFAVYKLIDTSLTAPDAWGVPLESLRLAPSPFFTAKDLILSITP